MNGNFFVESNLIVFRSVTHQSVDLIASPSFVITKQNFSKLQRIAYPHATMAVSPALLLKELFARSIMKLDGMPVGEHELDDSESIASARRLIDMILADVRF